MFTFQNARLARYRRWGTVFAAVCLSIPLSITISTSAMASQPATHSGAGSSSSPQPLSHADMNKGGANNGGNCGAYCSTRDGSPSLNGNGGGKSTGKPCAGCVGKADNKNPPGQAPNGSDRNNGYECDGNHGIGKGNPAHTACKPTTPPKDCLGVVNGHATAAQCNPPKDCLGVVNGHATAAQCNPPKDCLGVVNGHATAADCVTTGGGGNPATGPVVTPVVGPGPVPPLVGGAGAPATAPVGGGSGAPAALPFTGSNAALMAEGAALLLLAGLGVVMLARKRELHTARK